MTAADVRSGGRTKATVLAVVGLGAVVAAAVAGYVLLGGDQRDVLATDTYRLEHRCSVDGGLMSISGAITDSTGLDRTVDIEVSVIGPGSDEPLDTATIVVDIPARTEVQSSRLLADYDSIGRGLVVDADHSCQVAVYNS